MSGGVKSSGNANYIYYEIMSGGVKSSGILNQQFYNIIQISSNGIICGGSSLLNSIYSQINSGAIRVGNLDPYYGNVSLLLHMNGSSSDSIYDYSQYNNSITKFGNASLSSNQSKYGGSSAYFDGNGDYLTTNSSANLAFGTNDFTFECWFYTVSKLNAYPAIISNGNWDSNFWGLYDRHLNYPNVVSLWCYNYSGSTPL